MTDDLHRIPSGPFKGKKIVFAPTTGVNMFEDIADEFIEKIFDFKPGEWAISDESNLSDFIGLGDDTLEKVNQRVLAAFDVDIADIKSGNLLEILMRIHKRRFGDAS